MREVLSDLTCQKDWATLANKFICRAFRKVGHTFHKNSWAEFANRILIVYEKGWTNCSFLNLEEICRGCPRVMRKVAECAVKGSFW